MRDLTALTWGPSERLMIARPVRLTIAWLILATSRASLPSARITSGIPLRFSRPTSSFASRERLAIESSLSFLSNSFRLRSNFLREDNLSFLLFVHILFKLPRVTCFEYDAYPCHNRFAVEDRQSGAYY